MNFNHPPLSDGIERLLVRGPTSVELQAPVAPEPHEDLVVVDLEPQIAEPTATTNAQQKD
ncbi:MAG: hypothetical protein AAF628_22250 [Planctomycetota bacterium]